MPHQPPAPSAPAGSTATPRRSSWSPSTPARACSTPSSTCRPSPTASSARPSCRCSTTTTGTAAGSSAASRASGFDHGGTAGPGGGGRRVAAAALRRDDPGPVAGRAWWSPSSNAPASPLHRMLLGRRPGDASVPGSHPAPTDDDAVAAIGVWREAGGPAPELAVVAEPVGEPPRPSRCRELSVRAFSRHVDTEWRRTSYSGLTAVTAARDAVHAGVSSEPEQTPRDDEPFETPAPLVPLLDHGPTATATPRSRRWRGCRSARPSARWSTRCSSTPTPTPPTTAATWPPSSATTSPSSWSAGRSTSTPTRWSTPLVAVCDTPLGPAAGDLTLRRLPLADRLARARVRAAAGRRRRP